MPASKLKVIVTRKLPEPVETRMRELFDVELNEADQPMRKAGLAEAMGRADVLVPTLTDKIDAALLAQAGERLKLIANYGAGFDHIDVQTALSRGIMVTNTPGVLTEDTADIAMALILSVPRRLKEGAELMSRGEWQGWSPTALMGHRIGGKRLGILGMGRIGQAVAARAKAFGMRVIGTRARPQPMENVDEVHPAAALPDLWGRADIVVLSVPLISSTRGLVNSRALMAMKRDAILVDVSRGGVLDGAALVNTMRAGHLRGAALDVLEPEPPPADSPLWGLDRLILSPHCSAVYEGWGMRSFELFLDNLGHWRRGAPLFNIVSPERGY